ncbi:hypothetical protein YC2023_062968 [Brassica napus]
MREPVFNLGLLESVRTLTCHLMNGTPIYVSLSLSFVGARKPKSLLVLNTVASTSLLCGSMKQHGFTQLYIRVRSSQAAQQRFWTFSLAKTRFLVLVPFFGSRLSSKAM